VQKDYISGDHDFEEVEPTDQQSKLENYLIFMSKHGFDTYDMAQVSPPLPVPPAAYFSCQQPLFLVMH
jgi:hypothetical protein